MNIIVFDDYEQVSRAAAEIFAKVLARKPNAVLGLATGSTPLGMYRELIRRHKKEQLSFARMTTFNLDEYIGLTPDHPQSYRRFMQENLFSQIDIPPENTHVPFGNIPNEQFDSYDTFCDYYESEIAKTGGIDVQILGIGSDGHIAFNEPGTPLDSRTHVVALTEQTIRDNARFFESIHDVPRQAITMGVGTILEARKIVLLATGKNKAEAIRGAIEEQMTDQNTASALQNHPDTTMILDHAAASLLRQKK
ncbi:MAG: glucosamine-6-phosphate deaminase [Planctomycetaceae bacterium]|jgi:glucosamine-6-phosphate deaminase|nr:glucosamine-6-phosphate deaminase [Planctomycetaceae bacterium]